MKTIESIQEMRSVTEAARSTGKKVVLVPTMGFLHEGHRTLLNTGRSLYGADALLVLSIFVNPAQFGPKEDLNSYPRDMGRDLNIAKEAGVDVVFSPASAEMYPEGYQTYVEVVRLQDHLCGLSRPGHFRGVATVVLKLFNIVAPHAGIFGKKDYQQLQIIKRMVKDLDLGVGIIEAETVRESDGLAMSSRNSYLSAEERKAAKCLPLSANAAKTAFSGGVRRSSRIIGEVKKIIEKEPLAVIDYIKVCHMDTLEDLDKIEDGAVLLLAVRIGKARLIDNYLLS